MRKITLLAVFLIISFCAKAQDRIISINHDTIRCSIISINEECIMYEQKNKDGSLVGKFINLLQVAEYTRTVQRQRIGQQSKLKPSTPVKIPNLAWRLGLNLGKSTMPWYLDNISTSDAMPEFFNKIKSGFHINASAHYMVNHNFGLGGEYSLFNTNFSGSMQVQSNSSLFLLESENDRVYINYLAPSLLFLQHIGKNQRIILSESISGGLLYFRLEGQSTYPNVNNSGYTDVQTNSLFSSNTLSAKLGLAAEYRLNANVSVGVGGDFIWGSLKKASFESRGPSNSSTSVDNQEIPNAMNVSRIDYSFVLHYHF